VGARWTEGRSRLDYNTLKDFAGPVATVVAALSAVGVTGYFARRQWRTAKDTLLLDLFDKRFAVYQELRSPIEKYMGGTTGINELTEFTKAASRAQFLFGPQIDSFLEKTRKDLAWEAAQRDHPTPVSEARETAHVARVERLSSFFEDFDKLVAPYMSHHQRG
jgi:hypothetical protein